MGQVLAPQKKELAYKLVTVTPSQFRSDVDELCAICLNFDCGGFNRLLFSIVDRETFDSVGELWRPLVKIKCDKLDPLGELVSSQQLNLKQFYSVFLHIRTLGASSPSATPSSASSIKQEGGAATASSSASSSSMTDPLTATRLMDDIALAKAAAAAAGTNSDDGECIICMTERSDSILPCTHSFCFSCIKQWNVTSHTCPVCRTVADSDDAWCSITRPSDTEIAEYVSESLVAALKSQSSANKDSL